MKKLLLFVMLALPMAAIGQLDSLVDTGTVNLVIQKPVDTVVTFTNMRHTERLRRTGGKLHRVRIFGSAVDTTQLWEISAGKIPINETDTAIVDSIDVFTKRVVVQVWYRIKR